MVYVSVTSENVGEGAVSKPDRFKHQRMCVFLFTFSGAHHFEKTVIRKVFQLQVELMSNPGEGQEIRVSNSVIWALSD